MTLPLLADVRDALAWLTTPAAAWGFEDRRGELAGSLRVVVRVGLPNPLARTGRWQGRDRSPIRFFPTRLLLVAADVPGVIVDRGDPLSGAMAQPENLGKLTAEILGVGNRAMGSLHQISALLAIH